MLDLLSQLPRYLKDLHINRDSIIPQNEIEARIKESIASAYDKLNNVSFNGSAKPKPLQTLLNMDIRWIEFQFSHDRLFNGVSELNLDYLKALDSRFKEQIAQTIDSLNTKKVSLNQTALNSLINESFIIQRDLKVSIWDNFMEFYQNESKLESLPEEIVEEVNQSLDAISNQNALSREEFYTVINDLFSYIKQLIEKPKTPAIILVGIFLCNHVLAPVTEALTNKFIIEEFIEKKPETTKEAKAVLKEIPMEKELKKNYRMVTKETLVVRSSPKTNSNVLYVLNKSEIVAVKEKKRNWSLVLFLNEEGESQQGWVFTRYIKKIDYTNK